MAKVLVVEDTELTRRMLSDILTAEGHEIVGHAENAQMAVALYKRLKPDMMTMDCIMPDVGGVDTLKALEEILGFDQGAKVLVISALGQKKLVANVLKAGAKDFIVKPFKPAQVVESVRRILAG